MHVPDILGGFYISFATEKLHNSRSIYNFLDFLGDIGGLFDMLCMLAKILLEFSTFIIGSGLNQYILTTIFKVNNSAAGEDTLTSIRQR